MIALFKLLFKLRGWKITGGIPKDVKIGGKIHVWETKIVNNLNELICISRLTTAIIPKRK